MSIAKTAIIVDQAIRIGSCGSPELRAKLEARRDNIASLHCLQAGNSGYQNAREQYLRMLIAVLDIAIIESASLIDFTEARDDSNRNMKSVNSLLKTGNDSTERNSLITTTMRSCGFRSWERHRTGDDSSESTSTSRGHGNSYNFFRDTSASKNASAEEGFSEQDERSESEQLGQGTTDGSRTSQSVSHIKPEEEPDNGDGLSDQIVLPSISAELDGCGSTDWWIPSVTDPTGNIRNFVNCLSSAINSAAGLENYSAQTIKEGSGFHKSPVTGLPTSVPSPLCSATVIDDLCSEEPGSGRQIWEAKVAALPPTFTNYYSGTFDFEFSASIVALGTGIGFNARFKLEAGESFSQMAKIDQSYDYTRTRTVYCSDGGTLSAKKARSENLAKSAAQTKNDRHRRGESASQTGSQLNAISSGSMRFSGKSESGSDRSYSRIGDSTSVRNGSSEKLSSASLVDISRHKMESVTRYRHQIAKMLKDLATKTKLELDALYVSKGRNIMPLASRPEIQRPATVLGRTGAMYMNRASRYSYPLRKVGIIPSEKPVTVDVTPAPTSE